MRDSARLVAVHLLRIRAGADVSRRLRADLVSTALEGGSGAFEAMRRLRLADQPVVVVALAVADPAERSRLADGLAMHLSAIHPRCAAALVGDVVYGLIPVAGTPASGGEGMELRDLAAAHGDRPTGPVARLAAYDAEHESNLVATLRAWLDAFGDVAAASAALYVHPNTFRYRLRRVTVSAIDLADPEQRFATMLELRVVHPAAHPPQ
jgi:hypothetical protein